MMLLGTESIPNVGHSLVRRSWLSRRKLTGHDWKPYNGEERASNDENGSSQMIINRLEAVLNFSIMG